MRKIKNNKIIYLDYAATTPMDSAVKKAMEPYFSEKFGNPGSLHWFGQEASSAVFEARRVIARAVGVDYKNIIFTGSATEANNLALRGALKNFKIKNPKIIISAIEHESILATAKDLSSEGRSAFGGEKDGVEVVVIPVNKEGMVDLQKLAAALDERTVLVSVMYANNEVGAIQPIAQIARLVEAFRVQRLGVRENEDIKTLNAKRSTLYPLLHTDAVQAFQYLNCNMNELGVDLMTISAHKIYGPKGIGALCVREGLRVRGQGVSNQRLNPKPYTLYPQITGGGQEWGLRSGTENVASIVGFGKAAELVLGIRNQESGRIKKLTDYLWAGIKKIYPKAILNGSALLTSSGSEKNRLPNNLNVYFPGKKAEELLIALDLDGVAVSAGAACSARSLEPSYVLEAMGFSHERCNGSLRFTLGRPTTKAEIEKTLKILKNILRK